MRFGLIGVRQRDLVANMTVHRKRASYVVHSIHGMPFHGFRIITWAYRLEFTPGDRPVAYIYGGACGFNLSHFSDEDVRDKSRWIGVIKIFVTNYDLYCTLMECKPQDGASDESPDGRVVLKAIPASHKAHY